MQRELKFRAWRLDKRCYTQPYTLSGIAVVGVGLRDEKKAMEEFSMFQWEQFTGLHDKNGKEIYEGDIVEHKYASYFYGEAKDIFVVKYIEGGFYPFAIPEDECSAESSCLAVAGNIHENPELICNT